AVTFLHQMQRPRKHDPELGDYIETSLDDIAIANELAHQLFGQSQDDLSFPSRQLLRLVGDYVSRRAVALKTDPGKVEFTRRELREAIKWTEARLRLHLGELMRLEYVHAAAGRWGKSFSHQLAVDPDEIEAGGRFIPGLKDVETLRKEAASLTGSDFASVTPNFASQNGHFADTSQVPVCEIEMPAVPHKHRANGHHNGHFAANGRGRHYVLRVDEPRIRIEEAAV
ncbi:MAG: hypothetical protein WC657_07255, partial [Candidatus Paceibacterota bacterium]